MLWEHSMEMSSEYSIEMFQEYSAGKKMCVSSYIPRSSWEAPVGRFKALAGRFWEYSRESLCLLGYVLEIFLRGH